MIYGFFNDPVTIQEKTKVSNGRGGWSEQWVTVKDAYADIRPLGTQEVLEYRKMQVKADTKIYMKYDPDFRLHTECQLLTNDRAFEIEIITNPRNENKILEIISVGVDI